MTQTSNGSITITDLTDITDVYLQYCMAVDSITTAAAITAKTTWTPPERGWSTEYPTWQSGYQIWIREVTKKEGIAQLKYGTPYLDKAVNQINNNISNIQTKIKKIWSDSTGSYMASGISGNDVTESNVNTYGFNSKSTTTGISFNYNAIPLTTLGTDGLKLYSPVLTNSIITGNRLDATLTSEGLKLLRGGIEAGTKNTSDYIYVYSHDDATNHTLAINNSGNKSDWRIIAGKNFGVDKAGNLYANEAHINGEITATSLTIESKAPVSGLSTSNIDGMNNYALQKSLDSEITQRKAIYAVSTTEATIAEKTTELGTPSGFVLYKGTTVTVKFDNGNSTTTPTLNVNGTGEKTIKSYTGAALAEAEYTWPAGVTITFTYDGSYWRMQDGGASQAKADAATAKAGVDTLNTYIRSCDDGMEVARKDANGNYVGYKSIQTADGLEVRTADDVVVARYGNSVKIGQDSGYAEITRESISLANGAGAAFDVDFGSAGIRVVETFGGKLFKRNTNYTTGEVGRIAHHTRFPVSDYSGKFWADWKYTGASGNTLAGKLNVSITKGNISGTADLGDYGTLNWSLLFDLYSNVKGISVGVQVDEVGASVLFESFNWDYMTAADAACQVSTGVNPDKTVPYAFLVGNGSADTPSNAFLVDWDGNVTAKGNVTARLVNNTQAGAVTITPNKDIKIFSSTWYYGVATVAFDKPFDALPALNVTSQGGINIVYVSDVSTTKFNITVCRPTTSAVNVHWMAMKRTQ